MVLLYTFLAVELLIVLHLAMYIDGRRATPSMWIRSDVLLAIAANTAVCLLIFSIAGLFVTVRDAWLHGMHAFAGAWHLWAIAGSVVVTWFVMKKLSRRMRLLGETAMASAVAAAMPQVPELVVPRSGTPGNGAMAG